MTSLSVKSFTSLTSANAVIAPTTRTIGGVEVSNANGGFKNATVKCSCRMTRSPFAKQIENRNFLCHQLVLNFSLGKTPKRDFFCTSARIPELSLQTATQPGYLKDIDVPGEKLSFGDLTLRFLVDEDMVNYMAIHNWLTGLGFPETTKDFADLTTDADGLKNQLEEQFSDGSLSILNSNYRVSSIVKFQDLFPVSLTSLEFDTTQQDIQYFTAEATFRYTVYYITDSDGRTRL